jgi:hypothetical protein
MENWSEGGSCSRLEAMGFSKAMAARALAATRGDMALSVAWLVEHAGDQQQQQQRAEEQSGDQHRQAESSSYSASQSSEAASAIDKSSSSVALVQPAVSSNSLPSAILKLASVAAPPDTLCDLAFSCEIMDDPVVAVRSRCKPWNFAAYAERSRLLFNSRPCLG